MLHHFFPDLVEDMDKNYNDPRRYRSVTYKFSEIVLAAVYMYMLRCGSRNSMNGEMSHANFKKNYKLLFGLKCPHMDTVNDVFEKLEVDVLEKLKRNLIKELLSKRVLHKFRLLGKYFKVVIDGTGIFKFDKEPYKGCPYKTSKTGVKTYSQSVVEAKLVARNGFCISLGSEWIVNEDGKNKQDCEYNAAMRLFDKLKKQYPRLPICILLDGLFSKIPIKEKIKAYGWEFIIVWKNKTLYALQDEIGQHRREGKLEIKEKTIVHNLKSRTDYTYEFCRITLKNKMVSLYYMSLVKNDIHLDKTDLNKKTKFVFMTSIDIDLKNYEELISAGRMRWKIENEGFNIQKNNGYGLHHKMNRNNVKAIKNYYTCLQIAHLFDQLLNLATNTHAYCWSTVTKMWEYFISAIRILNNIELVRNHPKCNFRY
jgi:hypothetical protein